MTDREKATQNTSNGITDGKITIAVQEWPNKKLPVLAVYDHDENCWYKVASFNDKKSAVWFCEVFEEAFGSLFKKPLEGENDG